MLKKICTLLILGSFFLITGCGQSDKKVAEAILGDVSTQVVDLEVDYLPTTLGYFAILEFGFSPELETGWVTANFKESDCQVFEALYAGDYISNDWWSKISEGQCYTNTSIVKNSLAEYNELSLLIVDDKALLYAAGTNDETLTQ